MCINFYQNSLQWNSFSHITVVTYVAKACASLLLVVMNSFFVYFTILRAAEKGSSWQWSFVLACLFQILVEVFLYESLECFWVSGSVVFDNFSLLYSCM